MKWSFAGFACLGIALMLGAQQPPEGKDPKDFPKDKKDFFKDMKDFFKGPPRENRKLVKEFDKDSDGRLNTEERQAAREKAKAGGDKKGGFGPKKGFPGGKEREPGKPGPNVAPADVKNYPDAPLYDPTVLRTLFLTFENKDWENELADFYHTDVEVPATLTVDGKKYENVGVHFRGASSYFSVPAGLKRSLNLSMDFVDDKQRLYGSKTLNLLNCNDDPTFMHTVLFSHIARQYLPAPKANFVKVVINGESWGVYANVQQFNKDFVKENLGGDGKGARWKIKGSPGGGGSLDYLGEDIEAYKRLYEMKTNDGDKAWKDLINLCKVLTKTPPAELEKALAPILDIDGALRFLAVDIALINDDGYWTRGSDYSLYRDNNGKFHVFPHDMNEAFGPAKGGPGGGFKFPFPGGKDGPPKDGPQAKDGPPKDGPPKDGPPKDGPKGFPFPGPGFGPGGPGKGVELDPLTGLDDPRKPLRSKLLAVPSLRAKYLEYVKAVAKDGLDWEKLGPVVKRNRELIAKEVEIDTRKLTSLASFEKMTADTTEAGPGPGGPRGFGGMSLRAFADQRRAYLLDYREKK